MKIDVLTLFPNSFEPLKESIIGRATKNNKLKLNIINIRDFSKDKHHKCDDTPYGGGEGMVLTPQPLFDSIKSVKQKNSHIIYLSPKGRMLTQNIVQELSEKKHLVLICGHYEGVDQRVIDEFVDDEISIGDYVLTGGELPAMVLIDSVSRLLDGVLGNSNSYKNESFSNNLLECPYYTKPSEYEGLKVPEVLQNGNHKQIELWKQKEAIKLTKQRRPELVTNNIIYKELDKSYSQEIAKLTNETIMECERKFYENDKVLKHFVKGDNTKFVENSFDKAKFFGAIFNDKLVGFIRISLEKQRIQAFFVDVCFQGFKIGTKLFEMAKECFQKHNINEIVVDSSLFAIKIYEKLGFKVAGEVEELDFGMKYQTMKYEIK